MFAIIYLLGTFIADLLKSRRRLEVENLFLRHKDPRRAAEARIRSRGVNSFEVHDRAPWTAIAELAGVRELAAAAKVSTNTITRFERGEELLPRTITAIRKALESAGVRFIAAGKSGGAGVRLRE